jgi:hypothetical protein
VIIVGCPLFDSREGSRVTSEEERSPLNAGSVEIERLIKGLIPKRILQVY